MTWPLRTWMSRLGRLVPLGVAIALTGCSTPRKVDVLESRLRHQEDMIASYQSQLDRAKTELDIARRESASLRAQLADAKSGAVPAEHIDASFRASEVVFSTLMTGGTDLDGQPGDDGLSIVLVPQGPDGEIVKVPGQVEIEAFDLSSPQGAVRIGYWVFDKSEIHDHWHSGVIQSGYQFQLPWQDLPQSEKILLHGRLVAIDGRQFDTTHTIRIAPPDPALAARRSEEADNSKIRQLSATSEDRTNPSPEDRSTDSLSQSWSNAAPVSTGKTREFSPQTKSSAQSYTGREFTDRMRMDSPLGVGRPASSSGRVKSSSPRSTVDSPQPDHSNLPWGSSLDSIQSRDGSPAPDQQEGDDAWYRETRRTPVRTSDAWTDATIPYLR